MQIISRLKAWGMGGEGWSKTEKIPKFNKLDRLTSENQLSQKQRWVGGEVGRGVVMASIKTGC